jgi:hypothetical protein
MLLPVLPVVRPKVHDAYWRFAAERHQIFLRRFHGTPGPLTDNRILKRFKFCNAFRAADRVSQYLIRDVIYGPRGQDLDAEDVFLRIILFRLFSKEATWDAIEEASDGLCRATLDIERLGDVLEELKTRQAIYTAAFILAAPSVYGHSAKHRNHLALVADMFRPGGLGTRLGRAKSLEEVYEALIEYPMIGPFLGYQITVDLNYSEHLPFDEDDFTVPGPGAVRGLQKVFVDPGDWTPRQLIMRMVDRQEQEFHRLDLGFPGLFGRRLHAIDCQGLFCETDKYSREAFPELRSNRVRIKQEYRQTPRPLPLFFPPKWGINDQLAPLGDPIPSAPIAARERQLRLSPMAPIQVGACAPSPGRADGQLELATG